MTIKLQPTPHEKAGDCVSDAFMQTEAPEAVPAPASDSVISASVSVPTPDPTRIVDTGKLEIKFSSTTFGQIEGTMTGTTAFYLAKAFESFAADVARYQAASVLPPAPVANLEIKLLEAELERLLARCKLLERAQWDGHIGAPAHEG